MSNFNITTKSVANTTTLHLEDPSTGEKMYADDAQTQPLTIEIFGKASKQYRTALSALSRKSLARKGKQQSFEANVEDNTEILVTISKVASNFDMGDGVAIDNADAFRTLYNNPQLFWVKDQVQAALEEVELFLQK